jgi:8-oxo-dGTP diphosphatase
MSSVDPPAPFHPTATRRIRSTVRVGVGVLVCQGSKIFAGVRKGSHGSDTLALPGGHLEMYESFEQCAIREVQEELDLPLRHVQYGHVCNNPMPDDEKHYVTIFMMGRVDPDAIPKNAEPEKCEGWDLYDWNELQAMVGSRKLFSPLESLVRDAPVGVLNYLNTPT